MAAALTPNFSSMAFTRSLSSMTVMLSSAVKNWSLSNAIFHFLYVEVKSRASSGSYFSGCCFSRRFSATAPFLCQFAEHHRGAGDRRHQQAAKLSQQHFLGGNVGQLLHPGDVQCLACECPCANDQLVVGPREVGHHFRGGDGIGGKAVDQRTGHLAAHNLELAAGHSTASQGVFQHAQVHALAARVVAQFGHIGDRDAAVFRHHQRLSFSGERGHFINDRLLLTAIQTQGLLLLNVPPARACRSRLIAATNCLQETPAFHPQRDRHLRWPSSLRAKPRDSPIKRSRLHTNGLGWPTGFLRQGPGGPPRRPALSGAGQFLFLVTPRWTACPPGHPDPWSTRPQPFSDTHPCWWPAWPCSRPRSAPPGCLAACRIRTSGGP